MASKTLKQFIAEHEDEITAAVNRLLNHVPRTAGCFCPLSGTDHSHHNDKRLDYRELRQWVLNDEGLYNWARSEGVRI